MNVVSLRTRGLGTNWFPLKPAYAHDDSVTTQCYSITGADDLTLYLDETFSTLEDYKVNNYSTLSLTNQKQLHELVGIDTPFNNQKDTFTTTLTIDENDPRYIRIPVDKDQDDIDLHTHHDFEKALLGPEAHDYYFEVNISGDYLSIFHESSKDGQDVIYHLCPKPEIEGVNYEAHATRLGFSKIDSKQSGYKFQYYIDRDTSALVLLTKGKFAKIVTIDLYGKI